MKIICVGRNYLEHAHEMRAQVPELPMFFCKPDTALLRNNQPFFYPDFSSEIHYEVEVVIKICKLGKSVSEKFASNYYNQVGLGIDFTARDIQRNCKEKGMPWEISKAFDGSAAISPFLPLETIPNLNSMNFRLDINGKMVQTGNTSEMIFRFDTIVSYISQFITLRTGDLIFTGTPAGVGPVFINDLLEAYLNDKKMLRFRIK
ncbi:MAG: fumarylacetoacetate hydrolase family protein [Lentimicrobiaceae bacterium]|nr:fumarylacetoacetate hydrolase family protein [Lentimicrobiaceae bacterium]